MENLGYEQMLKLLAEDNHDNWIAMRDGSLPNAIRRYGEILMDYINEQSDSRIQMFYLEGMEDTKKIWVMHWLDGRVTDITSVSADTRRFPMAVQINKNGEFSRYYDNKMVQQSKKYREEGC
jgi:hypothetical protein